MRKKIAKFQSNSANYALWVELNDENAQTINGGAEAFTIENDTTYQIDYSVDGTRDVLSSNYYQGWTAPSGGYVVFDKDGRSGYQKSRKYNLSDGRIYAFQPNEYTSNPYDVDLYDIT